MALGGNGVVLARFARRNGEPIEAFVGDVVLVPDDAGGERVALKLLPFSLPAVLGSTTRNTHAGTTAVSATA